MQAAARPRKPRPNPYRKVLDSRKRRVHGLWQRNARIYANLTVADDLGGRLRAGCCLQVPHSTMRRQTTPGLVTERADDRLRPLGLGKQ